MTKLDTNRILLEIQNKLYSRDVDKSINIFLCGASTDKKDSIRNLIYEEIKEDSKFNIVFPEILFSNRLYSGSFNLLKLEGKLASDVDIIILPLEGKGTICELGAFAVNDAILPKLIIINYDEYSKEKSFINIGPIDLVKKHNNKNLILYDKTRKLELIDHITKRLKFWRIKERSFDLDNIFNLSRYILYIIALFQPITNVELKNIVQTFTDSKLKTNFIDATIEILKERNRIEQDIIGDEMQEVLLLSHAGHVYVFEELIPRLQLKNIFTDIRLEILNYNFKKDK